MNYPGLILTRTDAYGDFAKRRLLPTPFSRNNVLNHSDTHNASRLPLEIDVFLDMKSFLGRPLHSAMVRQSHDTFTKMLDFLTLKSSIFAKDTKLSGVDIIFGEKDESLTPASFEIVLGRLVEVSGWERNIRSFDRHLGKLSTKAMLKASLDTFRPIPTLR